jgi:hypothetical protein
MLDTAYDPTEHGIRHLFSAENAAAASFRHSNLHCSNFESPKPEMFQENNIFLRQEHATIS